MISDYFVNDDDNDTTFIQDNLFSKNATAINKGPVKRMITKKHKEDL